MPNELSGALKVTVTDFLHAAPVFRQAGDELGRLGEEVAARLAGLGNFWGNDAAGAKFAGTYLTAQDMALQDIGISAGTVGGVGDGLAAMAASYGITETANTAMVKLVGAATADDLAAILSQPVTRPKAPSWPDTGRVTPGQPGGSGTSPAPSPRPQPGPVATPRPVAAPRPPAAPDPQPGEKPVPVAGPGLLGEMLYELGVPWPQADQGRLMDAGDYWQRLAEGIGDIAASANNEAASIEANNLGQAVDAFARYWQVYGNRGRGELARLAGACRTLAQACYRYADAVIHAKRKIEEAGAEFAAVLAVGTLTATFTFGATEATADAIAGTILAGVRAVLGWLGTEEVPAIVEAIATDIGAMVGPVLNWAKTGAISTAMSAQVSNLIKMAFGEPLTGVVQQLKLDGKGALAGVVGGMLGGVTGVSAHKLAGELTQLGSAIASGEIKVANPAIGGSMLEFADLLYGPEGAAAADLGASAATQLILDREISVKDLTSDLVSSKLGEAIREMQKEGR